MGIKPFGSRNKLSRFLFHVLLVPSHQPAARDDCSGSVSAQVVAKVSAVEQRTADSELRESAGRTTNASSS
jgi:hypothetical protein